MTYYCRYCGAPLAEQAKFCGRCGKPVFSEATPMTDHPEIEGSKYEDIGSTAKKRTRPLIRISIIGGSVLLLLLAVLLTYFYVTHVDVYVYDRSTLSGGIANNDSGLGLFGDVIGKSVIDSIMDGTLLGLKRDGTAVVHSPYFGEEGRAVYDFMNSDDNVERRIVGDYLYVDMDGVTLIFREATKSEVKLFKSLVDSAKSDPNNNEASMPVDIVGYYLMDYLEEDGEIMTKTDFEEMGLDIILQLDEDGIGYLYEADGSDDYTEFTWYDGHIVMDGDLLEYTIDDETLTLRYSGIDDSVAKFSKIYPAG